MLRMVRSRKTIVATSVMLVTVGMSLLACSDESAAKRTNSNIAQEKRAKQKQEECQLIREAVSTLLKSKQPELDEAACEAIKSECGYKVPVMLRLKEVGEPELLVKIMKAGNYCQKEYDFAVTYGISVWKEHYDLLQAAVDKAVEECQEQCPSLPDDGR